jgi:hypothetical protein
MIQKWERQRTGQQLPLGEKKCEGCGKAPAGDVKLKQCAKCRAAWYCSAECQSERAA